jgi:hypothetical protein
MTTITIVDESTVGEKHAWSLDFLDETVSLRELIRQRIYQEVIEYNARLTGHFRGLVQPTQAERTLNGFRLPSNNSPLVIVEWQNLRNLLPLALFWRLHLPCRQQLFVSRSVSLSSALRMR